MVLLTPFQQALKFGVKQQPAIAIVVMKDTPAIDIRNSAVNARTPSIPTREALQIARDDVLNHDVLFRAFPKPLLLAFAPDLETSRHPKHGDCLILSAVGALAYQTVFDYMLECQKAKKEIPFSTGKELPYFKASRALIAARDIDADKVVRAILHRMHQLEYGVEFVRDLRVIYANDPSDELRSRIGKQIASVQNFKWFVSYEG